MKNKQQAEAAPANGQRPPPNAWITPQEEQLLKAAPALLEALRDIAETSVQHYSMSVYPGENKLVPTHNSSDGQHWVSAEHYSNVVAIARAAIAQAEGRVAE